MNVPYTLVLPTEYGNMLVNRFDINQTLTLLQTLRATDAEKIKFAIKVCELSAVGSKALDIGANFGTYSLALSRILAKKAGQVYSFEAQRIIYYMLCGSIALNSIENCFTHFACVGNSTDPVEIPKFNYSSILNFGSIEFGSNTQAEQLHQNRGTSDEKVKSLRVDDLQLKDVCYMKVDVEGMEFQVLSGALETIKRFKPVLQVEIIKSEPNIISNLLLDLDYKIYSVDGDFICIPSHLVDVYNFG